MSLAQQKPSGFLSIIDNVSLLILMLFNTDTQLSSLPIQLLPILLACLSFYVQVVKQRAHSMAAAARSSGDAPHGMLSVVGLPDTDLEDICK
jgi:hypothetical protein